MPFAPVSFTAERGRPPASGSGAIARGLLGHAVTFWNIVRSNWRFSDRLHRLFEQQQVRLHVTIEARTILAAAALVAENAGVCIADPFSLEAAANPRIAVRPLHPPLLIEVGVFFLRRRPLSILAEQFMSTLPTVGS